MGATPSALFFVEYFQHRVSPTVSLGLALILLISASRVARITGVSHWLLASSLQLDWDVFSQEHLF
jgi:Na+/H+-dicarboxylate symporter